MKNGRLCHGKGGQADYLSDKDGHPANDYATIDYVETGTVASWQLALTYVMCTNVHNSSDSESIP